MLTSFTNTDTDSKIILASTMDEIQGNIFGMGFGPIPFYRRCSVAVQCDEEHEDGCEVIVNKRVSHLNNKSKWPLLGTASPIFRSRFFDCLIFCLTL
jgi:hypothetical protein